MQSRHPMLKNYLALYLCVIKDVSITQSLKAMGLHTLSTIRLTNIEKGIQKNVGIPLKKADRRVGK